MDLSVDPAERSVAPWRQPLVSDIFFDKGLCGRSFGKGLLRFHDSRSGEIGQEFVDHVFQPRGLPAQVFAFDWLARQFAVTDRLRFDGKVDPTRTARTIVVLDPFDMSITPWTDVDKFEHALNVPMAQEFLNQPLFDAWRASVNVDRLTLDRCAGATVPKFYGGIREPANLTNDDVDVYLTFTSQLWDYFRSAPPGSPPPRLSLPEGR
jgi:hypothetical protein